MTEQEKKLREMLPKLTQEERIEVQKLIAEMLEQHKKQQSGGQ